MNLIFLGAPGSGKGTQAERLQRIYGIQKISTGDILRNEAKNLTALGKKVKEAIGTGVLISDEIMIDLISNNLDNLDTTKGFIIDGFPRTSTQAEALDFLFYNKNIELNAVIELQVSYEILAERITSRFTCADCNATYNLKSNNTKIENICNNCMSSNLVYRADDNLETLKTRLKKHEEEIKDILVFYNNKNILHSINGTDSIDFINRKIESIIKSIPNMLT